MSPHIAESCLALEPCSFSGKGSVNDGAYRRCKREVCSWPPLGMISMMQPILSRHLGSGSVAFLRLESELIDA
jgi:hypothetical protein